MTSFLTPFMGSSINIALPAIGSEFSMDAISLSWVVSAYLLASAVFLLPIGRVADIYGRKKILLLGIIIFTVFSFLLAIATSSALIIALRALQGLGSAMIFGTGVAILTSAFPARERGRALGINVASVYLGLSLGPFLGGILTESFGWRSIFLINVPLGLIVIFMILWKLKGEWAEAQGEKFDFTGSIIYGISLISFMYGLSILPDLSAVWFLAIGVLCLLAFIWWEMKSSSPILNLNLIRRNMVFAFSNIAALINYSATFAVAFLLSLYLQYTQGMSAQTAGIILIAQPIVMAIVSPLAGRLSDKIQPRIIASLGMALTAAGLLYFSFIDADTTIAVIILGLVIVGLGLALFSSPNTNAIMSSVENKYYGVSSAILSTMRMVGNILSMGIVTVLFAVFIGRVEITPEYYAPFLDSMKVTFVVFAVLCFLGIFASLARGRLRRL
ncbi:MAG: MFS transporter [Dehalococcoidales bacterium]|jgi:EmrB/QacA subfamily drug resistance transporter|nr:MFS transporter [Dehalococcoidales bacterium]